MKKLFIATAVLMSSLFGAKAQIVIEQSDFPTPGDMLMQGRDTLVDQALDLGSSGTSQTWDFSSLQVYTFDTLNFEEPSNVLYGDSFPEAFLALTQFGGYGFAANNSGTIEIVGFSGSFSGGGFGIDTNIVARFQDPQTLISIPANYGDSFIDTSLMDIKLSNDPPVFQLPPSIPITIDSIRIKRTMITNSEIDGWGTVTGHTGTFDCLRQVNQEYSEDSIFIYVQNGFPPFIQSGWSSPSLPGTFDNPRVTNQVRYNFLTKELGYFYASIVTDDQDSILSATFETIPDSCCVTPPDPGSVEEYGSIANVNVYPNPAVDQVTIAPVTTEQANFTLFDLTGKLVINERFAGRKTIDLEGLERSIYLYRVTTIDGEVLRSGKLSLVR